VSFETGILPLYSPRGIEEVNISIYQATGWPPAPNATEDILCGLVDAHAVYDDINDKFLYFAHASSSCVADGSEKLCSVKQIFVWAWDSTTSTWTQKTTLDIGDGYIHRSGDYPIVWMHDHNAIAMLASGDPEQADQDKNTGMYFYRYGSASVPIETPTNVAVTTAVGSNTITWTAATGTVNGYKVYRAYDTVDDSDSPPTDTMIVMM